MFRQNYRLKRCTSYKQKQLLSFRKRETKKLSGGTVKPKFISSEFNKYSRLLTFLKNQRNCSIRQFPQIKDENPICFKRNNSCYSIKKCILTTKLKLFLHIYTITIFTKTVLQSCIVTQCFITL